MLQVEFTQRTNIFVTPAIFEEIHKQYMESDLDKDAWCKQYKHKHEEEVTRSMAERIAELEQTLVAMQKRAEIAAAAAQNELINSLNKQNAYAEELIRIYDIDGDHKAMQQLFSKLNERYMEKHQWAKPHQK